MLYIHYCKTCSYLHLLNGHKLKCPKCENSLTELSMSYMDYINMSLDERALLLAQCAQDDSLQKMSTVYRMYKYSKAYKKVQDSLTDKTEQPPQE